MLSPKRVRSDVGLLYYFVGKYWSRENRGAFKIAICNVHSLNADAPQVLASMVHKWRDLCIVQASVASFRNSFGRLARLSIRVCLLLIKCSNALQNIFIMNNVGSKDGNSIHYSEIHRNSEPAIEQ